MFFSTEPPNPSPLQLKSQAKTSQSAEKLPQGLPQASVPDELKCCGQTFSRKSSLKRHVQRQHSARIDSSIKCTHCGKAFRHQDNYLQHKKIHMKKKKKRRMQTLKKIFICEYCQTKFKYKPNILRHFLANRCVIHK